MNDIQLLLNNRWNQSYLCDYIQKNYCMDNIINKYQPKTHIVAKLLLNLTIINLCFRRNTIGLLSELWNKICGYIENDIQYFIPTHIKIDHIELTFANKNKSFSLTEFFKTNLRTMDPIELLKHINVGDFLLQQFYGDMYTFFIVYDINKEYHIIKLIEEKFYRYGFIIVDLEQYYKQITYSYTRTFDLVFFEQEIQILNFNDFILKYAKQNTLPMYVLDMECIKSTFNFNLVKTVSPKMKYLFLIDISF
jgi:hypothetical protein